MKYALLLLILLVFASCKTMLTGSKAAKYSTHSLMHYQRAKVDMPPVIVGEVSATQEKANPLLGTFFLDG